MRPGNGMRGADTGFTLIEILVAMTLIALILLPTLGRISGSTLRASRKLEDRAFAEGLLEELVAQDVWHVPGHGQWDTTLAGRGTFRTIWSTRLQDSTRTSVLFVVCCGEAAWDTMATVRVRTWAVR